MLIIVIIIYLAFSFWCHWWVNNIAVWAVCCAVHGCLRKIIKKCISTHTHTLVQANTVLDADYYSCTHRDRARCQTAHSIHTDPLLLFRSIAFALSFWQSWYSYEGRNLTVATHEVHNASRLLAINYTKSLEKLFQLKRAMFKTSRLTINFYLQIKCL